MIKLCYFFFVQCKGNLTNSIMFELEEMIYFGFDENMIKNFSFCFVLSSISVVNLVLLRRAFEAKN